MKINNKQIKLIKEKREELLDIFSEMESLMLNVVETQNLTEKQLIRDLQLGKKFFEVLQRSTGII